MVGSSFASPIEGASVHESRRGHNAIFDSQFNKPYMDTTGLFLIKRLKLNMSFILVEVIFL